MYDLSIYVSEKILPMQVFSAFGFVHKITTFEKTAGFQVYMFNLIFKTVSLFSFGLKTQAHFML